ncbi:MAG: flavodoxin family protein [Planctomycetes bacterium]|nr:flavodoxin family protein [Planctomycetota bacterium]
MKVIGFSAGASGRAGNVDRMVKAILEKSGHEVEFVKLTDLNYSGCKGCVQKCARPQVCRLADDAQPYYEKIKQADAVVIGSPVYFDTMTATVWAFIERFFGYRHVDIAIEGKPVVLAVSGAMMLDGTVEQLHKVLGAFKVNVLDTVKFMSKVPPCFKCGRHKQCEIGGMYHMLGDAAKQVKVTQEMFAQWEDDSDAVAAVEVAAAKLKDI